MNAVRSLGSVVMRHRHHDDRHTRALDDFLSDAADEQPGQTLAAVSAHDDQIDTQPLRVIQNGICRHALYGEWHGFDAGDLQRARQLLRHDVLLAEFFGDVIADCLWPSVVSDELRVGIGYVQKRDLRFEHDGKLASRVEHASGDRFEPRVEVLWGG